MGFIFDMDGVLIDSNAAHYASWRRVAAEDGVDFPEEIFWKTYGMTSEFIVEHYWNCGADPHSVSSVAQRKEDYFRESVVELVDPIPGACDFVRYLVEKNVKIAVGSSAPRVNVDFILDFMKIRDCFGDAVVAGNEVCRGKPDPEIFLVAASKLGENPRECLALDDSRSGVNAGKAAKMTTIGFFSAGHREDEYENADVVVRSFDELRPLLRVDSEGNVKLSSPPMI